MGADMTASQGVRRIPPETRKSATCQKAWLTDETRLHVFYAGNRNMPCLRRVAHPASKPQGGAAPINQGRASCSGVFTRVSVLTTTPETRFGRS